MLPSGKPSRIIERTSDGLSCLTLFSAGSRLLLLVLPDNLLELFIGGPALLVIERRLVDARDELDDGKLLGLRLNNAVNLKTVRVHRAVDKV